MHYPGALIIISHDRDFLKGLTSRTIEFYNGHLKEYIGDIDEMLAKKGVENLEMLGVSTNTKIQTIKATPKVKVEPKELKALQRQFSQIEKEIAECEQLLKEKEKQLADPEFYKQPGFEVEVNSYEVNKQKMSWLMKKWEELAERLENQ